MTELAMRDPRIDPRSGDRLRQPGAWNIIEVGYVADDRIYYQLDFHGEPGGYMMMREAWKEWAKSARILEPDMRHSA